MITLRNWSRRFLRTWPVAAIALSGLLLLIWTTVVETSRKAEEIFAQIEQLNAHHREVESRLRRLRSDVHLSGIYVRDYLLDTDRAHAGEYRETLKSLRQSHTTTLQELRRIAPPQAAARLDALEANLDDYWVVLDPLFDWSLFEKIMRSSRFLRREVLPRREAVLAMAAEIEKINDTNLAARRAEIAQRQDAFRRSATRRLWRNLLVGSCVALVAVLRLRTLERRSDEERRRSETAEREMRHLSQQLVAAQEEERKKLTRELHDHVGQMLTALRLEIGRAQREPHPEGAQTPRILVECKRLVDTVVRSVRDLVMGLRPSMLDDFGLAPALEWHVRDFRRRSNIRVKLELDGDLDALPDTHRTCVYRVVQEALTNCARHSHAANATVAVHYAAGRIELTVSDDGSGMEAAAPRGMGLLGMEERVRELGGSFAVSSLPGAGVTLAASIPVPPAETREEEGPARLAG